MTSSGRSGETPRWDCRASSRTKTRLRSIGAIRWLSSGSSMTPASLSSTLPRVRPASRRSSSIQLGSQEPSPIMSNSRAISSSRSAPPTGSATWRHSRQAGPATISSRSSRTRSTRLADKRLPWGFGWLRHPHIWGPMEREHEVRRVIELTDPKCVWLTTDTGHLTLGGMDAVRIMGDYFPRIAEVHLKDTYAKFRGKTSTPTQEQHRTASVYHNLGGGGVDFPAVFKLLGTGTTGARSLDLDGPRKGDDGFDAIGGNIDVAIDDYIAHNINYLRDVVGVRLPPLD
ncbi:MAG: hypothetical protein DMG02_31295 [Acidobacteria bacterium]|nr:MAG: hypothetical protein DMG01_06790 [Acidobacteriota bacterium]PYQ80592.1 MAG: hypothetical protein DMG03_22220 [Acidobacteriota bacterium]PYQ84390.1 MAG: hypothetical protein DMG02_31295 [Acidobacteriota bacterium]PYR13049.1 MAG: hypothetical protein DMF99_02480 [Acidobacteriota bacterium]